MLMLLPTRNSAVRGRGVSNGGARGRWTDRIAEVSRDVSVERAMKKHAGQIASESNVNLGCFFVPADKAQSSCRIFVTRTALVGYLPFSRARSVKTVGQD